MILSHLATHFDAQWSYTAAARAVTQEITVANPIYRGMTWERIGDQGQQWSVADAPYTRPEPVYQRPSSLTCLLSTAACG